MAELVYAHDLKSCLARDVGSTPTPGTQLNKNMFLAVLVGRKISDIVKIVMRP